jgi:RNA polymerase sigma-70 factor (ECF subfamily)
MDPVIGELDARTIERLRCRDVAALETAYRLHAGMLLRLARNLLADPCEAEDAVQEIFLKVFERAHQFDGMARFSTWLHRLAVNHCLNRLEHERRRRTVVLPEDDALPEADDQTPVDLAPTPLETAHRNESRARLERLLARLPDEQRAVFALREIEGLAYAEIAAELGVPVGTVMSRLARARARLLELLGRPSESPLTRRGATLRTLP